MSETLPLGTQILSSIETTGDPQMVFGSASARVARIVVTLDNHTAIRVTPTTFGGRRFFAFSTGTDQNMFNWL